MSDENTGVADIIRHAGDAFMQRHGATLDGVAHKVIAAICRCRTDALGARLFHCERCDTPHVLYNSCRNRHCPQCQGGAARRWLSRQLPKVLPAPYFHIVFTLPPAIADIAYANRRTVLDLLMTTAIETLTVIAADPKRFGVRIGGTAVLHTWNQKLDWHPHVHMVVANAGFDVTDGHYRTGSDRFLAPVKVLSRLFRRLMLERLDAAYRKNLLVFPGRITRHNSPKAFGELLDRARRTEWNVYAKPPFAGPRQLLGYLSRYTHRVAIGNRRITAFDGERVSFRYRKPVRKNHSKPDYGIMTLSAVEFIRRYLMHVLPARFHRIRHFGILANSNAKRTLARISRQTGWQPDLKIESESDDGDTAAIVLCPNCQAPMTLVTVSHSPGAFIALTDDGHAAGARAPPMAEAA